MRRLWLCLSAVALITGFIATSPASAQQSVNFYVGGFIPRSLDARGGDDVLFNNLLQSTNLLSFNIKDFNGATFGGEWLVGLGDLFDAGIGLGFYQRTAPSVYASLVNADQSEIAQDLKLRIVPITATVRFLPLGHRAPVRPYVGGGVGIFAWRYSETGQFVDPADKTVFTGSFAGSGTNAGPIVLAGVTVPLSNFAPGFEVRYQAAKGTLPASQGFAGPKIDLGGFNYLFVFNVRF
jgi:hypothetical protein